MNFLCNVSKRNSQSHEIQDKDTSGRLLTHSTQCMGRLRSSFTASSHASTQPSCTIVAHEVASCKIRIQVQARQESMTRQQRKGYKTRQRQERKRMKGIQEQTTTKTHDNYINNSKDMIETRRRQSYKDKDSINTICHVRRSCPSCFCL